MSYEFQSTLFRTRAAMLDAIAYEFMTAGGANSPAMVDDLIGDPATLAAECIGGWGLDIPMPHRRTYDDAEDDAERSHMAIHGYSAADLAEAFAGFIENRPDRAGEEDEEADA